MGPGLYATLDNLWITGPVPGIPGDFNVDGTVGAADYTVYRDHLGGNSAVLNGNGSGGAIVRHVDYVLWKQNFSISGTGSSAAVPEPASLVLMLLVGHAAFALWHRSMSWELVDSKRHQPRASSAILHFSGRLGIAQEARHRLACR